MSYDDDARRREDERREQQRRDDQRRDEQLRDEQRRAEQQRQEEQRREQQRREDQRQADDRRADDNRRQDEQRRRDDASAQAKRDASTVHYDRKDAEKSAFYDRKDESRRIDNKDSDRRREAQLAFERTQAEEVAADRRANRTAAPFRNDIAVASGGGNERGRGVSTDGPEIRRADSNTLAVGVPANRTVSARRLTSDATQDGQDVGNSTAGGRASPTPVRKARALVIICLAAAAAWMGYGYLDKDAGTPSQSSNVSAQVLRNVLIGFNKNPLTQYEIAQAFEMGSRGLGASDCLATFVYRKMLENPATAAMSDPSYRASARKSNANLLQRHGACSVKIHTGLPNAPFAQLVEIKREPGVVSRVFAAFDH